MAEDGLPFTALILGMTIFVIPVPHTESRHTERKGRDMKIGFEHHTIGRYVIDIDGSLRATNSRLVNAEEIIALHGRLAADATIVWEINGDTVPLNRGDRIELSEDSVAFFRSATGPRLFRSCAWRNGLRPRWSADALAA
jgi:hypothetical protein